MFERIFLIVLDSVGIGEKNDSYKFSDIGVNTYKHATESTNNIYPNLRKMGIYNLLNNTNDKTNAYHLKLDEESNGKDTLTGHLEMMGITTISPFKTYMNGFSTEIINKLKEISGRDILGNCVASGTEIIEKYGAEQMKTGKLIVYTSADSVLQIAAHENIIPLNELYRICSEIREFTKKDEYKLGRIIARPYIGSEHNFVRTANRHDYSLDPINKTALDILKENNYNVISIGKIADVFNNCGITESIKTIDNLDGMKKIIEISKRNFKGLCFANLNDFDSKYGHRRNAIGYGAAIKEFDDFIPEIINNLDINDLLIITADHGNDPTYKGTDHTREYVPLILYSKRFNEPKKLDTLKNFSHIGDTILDNFNLKQINNNSILSKLK